MQPRFTTLMLGSLLVSGCGLSLSLSPSIATPTALERQLLGEYEKLDRELVLASSVRGGASRTALDAVRGHAVEARALQRFNEDDLAELKEARCIAETLNAEVVARTCEKVSEGTPAARRRSRVVAEENRSRRDILAWAALSLARQEGRPSVTESQIQELRRTYHRLLKEAAGPGHLFEIEPGQFREVRP